jgi:hypothetical protein
LSAAPQALWAIRRPAVLAFFIGTCLRCFGLKRDPGQTQILVSHFHFLRPPSHHLRQCLLREDSAIVVSAQMCSDHHLQS